MSQYGRFISYTAVAEDLVGNDGVVVSPIGGHIHTVGADPLYVFGNAGTATLTWAIVGLTNHALLVGDGTGNMVSLAAVGATGEGLMGFTANNPVWTGSPTYSGTVTATTGLATTNGDLTIACPNVFPDTGAMQFYKSTAGGAITTGDYLGDLRWLGHDGTSPLIVTLISSRSSGTIGLGRIGTNLQFWTHPDSVAANPLLRMTIQPTGEVVIATPDSGVGLTVSGGGASILGITNINTSGAATTTIGYGSTGLTQIGNQTGNTDISGKLNLEWVSGDTVSSDLSFQKSRPAGPTPIITTGDSLGQIKFTGNDGAVFQEGARITSVSSGTIAAGKVPGNLVFWTKSDGAGAIATRLTIATTGEITIAAPDSGTGLTISGGGLTVTAGTITMPVAQFGVGVVLSTAAGVLSSATPGVAGTVLTSNGVAAAPTWQSPDELLWSRETGTPVTMTARGGYIQANAGVGLTTFVIPATAALGTQIQIIGESSGGWTITHAVGTNQYIQYGNLKTTTTSGSLSSSNRYDSVTLVCRVANTVWAVTSAIGVLNVA